ncbi:MAG: ComEA family DNA-binding protein [Oscillospiraceae bacterium]|nr:ComEA family DNA-binding protein [Oscillospiraceae bacterium]
MENRQKTLVTFFMLLAFAMCFAGFALGVTWEGGAREGTFAVTSSRRFMPAQASGAPVGAIDLNKASARELADLPGIGPVLAGRIVDYREANGPFAAIGDIVNVNGIGPAILSRIEQYVTVTKC